MDEPSNTPEVTGRLRPPPDLPRPLVSPWVPVIGGTTAWLCAFVVLLILGIHGVWLWTTLAGAGVGLLGMSIMLWQRAASRRGSRFGQRNL
nr:DUF2530 domain-containing protein [Saccharomonospora halophila]